MGASLRTETTPTPAGCEEKLGSQLPYPNHVDASELQSPHLTVRVDLVEHLGNEAILHGSESGLEITARPGPHALPEAGTRASFMSRPEHLHFFDAASQERIRG